MESIASLWLRCKGTYDAKALTMQRHFRSEDWELGTDGWPTNLPMPYTFPSSSSDLRLHICFFDIWWNNWWHRWAMGGLKLDLCCLRHCLLEVIWIVDGWLHFQLQIQPHPALSCPPFWNVLNVLISRPNRAWYPVFWRTEVESDRFRHSRTQTPLIIRLRVWYILFV